jgi:hypothetical protein
MSDADLLKALLAFALGIVSTYIGLYWKIRKELGAQYDKDLRADRLKCYATLWKHTEVLANYSPPGPVNYRAIAKLSADLRGWYFGEGGIFLSETAREAYFALQKALTALPATGAGEYAEPSEANVKTLRAVASTLRTALTADVGSRSKPLLPDV